MYQIKDIIFNLFGIRDSINDTGFQKKFNELLAEDFDSNEFILLQQSFQNLIRWDTVNKNYLDLRVQELRIPKISTDEQIIRVCYRFFDKFQKIKGTVSGFEVMFRMIGIDSEISITWNRYEGGFDSSNYKFDKNRKLDSCFGNFTGLNISLKCTKKITVQIIDMIYNVVNYNMPIDCYLNSITYNGAELGLDELTKGKSYNDSFGEAFGNYNEEILFLYLLNEDLQNNVLTTEEGKIINYV